MGREAFCLKLLLLKKRKPTEMESNVYFRNLRKFSQQLSLLYGSCFLDVAVRSLSWFSNLSDASPGPNAVLGKCQMLLLKL